MSDFNLPAGVSEDELDLDAYNKSNQASANEKADKELCPAGYQIARVGEMIRYLEDRVKFGFKADDPTKLLVAAVDPVTGRRAGLRSAIAGLRRRRRDKATIRALSSSKRPAPRRSAEAA